jgi:hypothetical protein
MGSGIIDEYFIDKREDTKIAWAGPLVQVGPLP